MESIALGYLVIEEDNFNHWVNTILTISLDQQHLLLCQFIINTSLVHFECSWMVSNFSYLQCVLFEGNLVN